MMHHTVPRRIVLCGAILCQLEIKLCRIIGVSFKESILLPKKINIFFLVLSAAKAGQKLNCYFRGLLSQALTKSATLNRLLHCSLWQFSGALFWFSRALFCISGGEIARSPRVIFSLSQRILSQEFIHIRAFYHLSYVHSTKMFWTF